MRPEQQKHRLTLGDAIAINLTGAVVLLQFRLLSFCLIALGAVLLAFHAAVAMQAVLYSDCHRNRRFPVLAV